MKINEIVCFIYEHALGMMDAWNNAILEMITETELTNDGFRIFAPEIPTIWVEMKEFRSTIFVQVHTPTTNFSSMSWDQKRARKIYDQMIDDLLAV